MITTLHPFSDTEDEKPTPQPQHAPTPAPQHAPAPNPQHASPFSGCLWVLRHWRLMLAILAIGIVGYAVWRIYSLTHDDEPLLGLKHTTTIADTPEEVRALRDIGQWEFLAAPCEELIEHHEAHSFGDKHIVKIFRGTLRIGIDMNQASGDWFKTDTASIALSPGVFVTQEKKAAILTLPDVTLLDSAFIDETRTTTFYEEGTFNAKVKRQLYDKATKAMMDRTLTKENLETARQTARDHFTRIFHAFGYEKVVINFTPTK